MLLGMQEILGCSTDVEAVKSGCGVRCLAKDNKRSSVVFLCVRVWESGC